MKYLKHILLLLFTLISLVDFTVASVDIVKDRYARFSSLGVRDGLSENKVLDIIQDKNGFIWIATTNGLNRYDGYHIVNYMHNPSDSTSISNNYIQTLAIDNDGIFWIGTKNGLNTFDYETETFRIWESSHTQNYKVSDPYIRKILPDENNILWLETVDGILNKIDTKSGEILYYPHHPVLQEYYSYHCLFKDSDGDLWVGNRGKGPYLFNPEKEKFKLIIADSKRKDKKRDQEIACVFEDSGGRFWMGGIDGFWRYYKKSEKSERIIPSSSFHLIEDKEGKLWLSGGKGVFRYNQKDNSAVHYINNEDDPHSLINNSVNALLEDRDGNIWIGTNEGISIFSKQTNSFKYIRHFSDEKNTLVSNNITAVLEDAQENIWFGTKKRGLNKWDPGADQFTLFQNNKETGDIVSNNISCLYMDKQNTIWVGLWQGVGFNKYNTKSNTFKRYALSKNSFKRDWYNSFLEDDKGRFLTGVWGGNGVHFFNRENENFETYNFNPADTPMDIMLNDLADDDSCIWTARNDGIIYKLDKTTKQFQAFTFKEQVLEQVHTKSKIQKCNFSYFKNFYSILKTRQKEILFATSSGIISLDSSRTHFTQLLHGLEVYSVTESNTPGEYWIASDKGLGKFSKTDGFQLKLNSSHANNILFGKKIHSINNEQNLLFLGTDEGLFIYNILKNSCETFGKDSCFYINEKVNTIGSDKKDNVFIGTNNKLMRIRQSDSKVSIDTIFQGAVINSILYSKEEENLYLGTNKGILNIDKEGNNKFLKPPEALIIYALKEDKTGLLWASSNQGLVSIHPESSALYFYNQPSKFRLSSHLVSFLTNDSSRNIWVGTTNKGVNCINSKTLEIDHFFNIKEDSCSFRGSAATSFLQQKNGSIWVGGNGLNRFDSIKKTFTHFGEKEGLKASTIFSILEDSKHNLWLGTENGLIHFNPAKKYFQQVNTTFNIHNFDFSGGAVKLSSEKFLFAGKKGAIIFEPNIVEPQNTIHSLVTFTGLKLFGEYIKDNINSAKPIEFKYDQNFFTIEFSALDYATKNKKYMYRLDGIDRNWVNANLTNSASYTNIPPGKYNFRVKLARSSAPENYCTIIVHPPVWQTWWFILSLIIIGVLVGYYFIQTIIKKHKTEEQRIVLEHKLLQLQMNPHFIFNVLIAIQSFIYRKDTFESGLYLSKFAKLMRIFLQNSRKEWISIATEIESLNYYLSLQQLRKEDKFEYNIKCINLPGLDYISIPPMLIQPFVENSIEHGFSDQKVNGKINIVFELKENILEATISDNGKGYHPENTASKKNHKHNSIATDIIRKRLEIMEDKKSLFGFTIKNIPHKNENDSGTQVKVQLPFKEEF